MIEVGKSEDVGSHLGRRSPGRTWIRTLKSCGKPNLLLTTGSMTWPTSEPALVLKGLATRIVKDYPAVSSVPGKSWKWDMLGSKNIEVNGRFSAIFDYQRVMTWQFLSILLNSQGAGQPCWSRIRIEHTHGFPCMETPLETDGHRFSVSLLFLEKIRLQLEIQHLAT